METESVKNSMLTLISAAQKQLKDAHVLAIGASPLAAAVPCIADLEKLQSHLSKLMIEINKLRGL